MTRRLNIETMRAIAAARGGRCLSEVYVNKGDKLLWECAEGHSWLASGGHVRNGGQWCPTCAGRPPLSLVDMQRLASEHGGRCLSETYTNNTTKMLWECSAAHRWMATAHDVRGGGHWCPTCAECLTLADMRQLAAERGGRCISAAYVNCSIKMTWECAAGHVWRATGGSVRNGGHWCPTCARRSPLTLDDMRRLAAARGGQCLSEAYVNKGNKLLWVCSKGHNWWASSGKVRNGGQWCPVCGQFRHEVETRRIFEALLERPFPSSWPLWLPRLQLDGYNEELKLAFEYQGRQHYERVPAFQRNDGDFERQIERDKRKAELCKAQGVALVCVPYTVRFAALEPWIRARLTELNFLVDYDGVAELFATDDA